MTPTHTLTHTHTHAALYIRITESDVFDDTGGTVCLHIEQKICSRAAFKVRMFQLFQAQVQLGLLGTVVNSESSELRTYDFQVFQEMAI